MGFNTKNPLSWTIWVHPRIGKLQVLDGPGIDEGSIDPTFNCSMRSSGVGGTGGAGAGPSDGTASASGLEAAGGAAAWSLSRSKIFCLAG